MAGTPLALYQHPLLTAPLPSNPSPPPAAGGPPCVGPSAPPTHHPCSAHPPKAFTLPSPCPSFLLLPLPSLSSSSSTPPPPPPLLLLLSRLTCLQPQHVCCASTHLLQLHPPPSWPCRLSITPSLTCTLCMPGRREPPCPLPVPHGTCAAPSGLSSHDLVIYRLSSLPREVGSVPRGTCPIQQGASDGRMARS